MDKKKLLDWISAQPEEHRITCRQILDLFARSRRDRTSLCTQFLTPEEIGYAKSLAAHFPDLETVYLPEDAERQLLCVTASDQPVRPESEISILRIEADDTLAHRHILGSVLATGIVRDRIGDIRIQDNTAEIMVRTSVAGLLLDTLGRIGRQPVTVSRRESGVFSIAEKEGETRRVIVPSTRLDAVIAAITNQSRSRAQAMIRRGEIKRNHTVVYDLKRSTDPGDVLSVRGFGRYTFLSQEGLTKKGNLVLTVSHTK